MSKDDFLSPADLKKRVDQKLAKEQADQTATSQQIARAEAARARENERRTEADARARARQVQKIIDKRWSSFKTTAGAAMEQALRCAEGEKRAPHGVLLRPNCSQLQEYGERQPGNHYQVRLVELGRVGEKDSHSQEAIRREAFLAMYEKLRTELAARGYEVRLEEIDFSCGYVDEQGSLVEGEDPGQGYYAWVE
jgi:hypothetical protein